MIIESRKNQIVVKSRGLINEKKLRDREGLIAAEGVKLCEEAIKAGLEPEYAVFSENAEKIFPEIKKILSEKCRVFTVTNEVYSYLSGQKSPQGIFLAAKLLDKSKNIDRIIEKDKIVLLDGIQDSGNLGTVIRSAEAFGIGGIILSPECADPYSPKTLRASMGSAFRLPVAFADLADTVGRLKERGYAVYAAMLDEGARKLREVDFPVKTALVIGNEGHGVSEAVSSECEKLYIPIQTAESLNAAVAASIIFYELSGQQ